jgi:DNA polymerase III subunit gamma/tau
VAYVSLYRKYRPQTFSEVVGQQHVTTTLAKAVGEGRTHHAYLFTGPRGTGKTSTARILAKALNCETGPTAEPDNTCTQCVAITEGSSVDVIEIDAASHGGVDDVRELRDRVAFAPASARTKVYIVDECHMLSTAGWNAFLKTVEEPPGHVAFVFATTEPHKVLPTILSRTQRFDFRRVPADQLAAHCQDLGRREGLEFEPGAIDLIVRAGDGSVRDTLSVLDQVVAFSGTHVTLAAVAEVLGAVSDELLIEAADAIATGDVPALCILVQRLADGGVDLRQFARDAVEHLRALFLLSAAPDAALVETTPERLARLTAQAGRLGTVELLRAVELLSEAQAQMRRGNTRLPLEIALVKAALPEASGDAAALAARMDRLERGTALDPNQRPAEAAPPSAATQPPEAPQAQRQPQAAEPGSEEPKSRESAERSPTPSPADNAPTQPLSGGPVDVDLVRDRWPAVLEAVKSRRRRLHAWLNEGEPRSVEAGVLTVAFRPGYAFHAENVAHQEWVGVFEAVFTELFGLPLRVHTVVADGEQEPRSQPVDETEAQFAEQAQEVAEVEAGAAAGALPDDEAAHDLAIAALQRDLGATLLEDTTGQRRTR